MSLSRFISLWMHPDTSTDPVSEGDLQSVERRLQTRLPNEYRDAVLQLGLPRPNIELLDAICDRQLDLRDVSDFLAPNEIVQTTEDWRDLGLPEELVAFATDCMGNLFCFPTNPNGESAPPVFYWDHDSKEVEIVASSFSSWIDNFCSLSPY